MIRINQIKMPIHHTKEQLTQKIIKTLKIKASQLKEYQIVKKSIDARRKPELIYIYSIDAIVDSEASILKKINDKNIMLTNSRRYQLPEKIRNMQPSPVIVGAGPAGLFCAYALVLSGYRPIIIERGKMIEERRKDVKNFWEHGTLHPHSNVQFGEGGAGTFSDGKLNTLVKDPFGRNRFVLETFVKFGSPEQILYENKPHIGTDILAEVITNMRRFMQENGAVFRFETCLTDYEAEGGRLRALQFNRTQWQKTECCILAIGHSARDTFRMLAAKEQLVMEAKSFAVGFRVEHPQEMINFNQYGEKYAAELPAAPYKVTANLKNGRGVYSFCMCPGGYVVNASSEQGRLAVNGMSYSGRNGKNANSAVIVSVSPEDFDGPDALAGVRFQEELEEKAFFLGRGGIPQQLFGDFCRDTPSCSYGAYQSEAKGTTNICNMRGLLPEALEHSFIEGMHRFAHSIPEFDREDAILSGIESRTSSPVRIRRNDALMADIAGIYPCGEGAGYAGGIMSAAMDGLKVAEAVMREAK